MSHLPDGQGGGGTPKPSFKVLSKKSTIHELMQVLTWAPMQHMLQKLPNVLILHMASAASVWQLTTCAAHL